jgi:hypothetical protein
VGSWSVAGLMVGVVSVKQIGPRRAGQLEAAGKLDRPLAPRCPPLGEEDRPLFAIP